MEDVLDVMRAWGLFEPHKNMCGVGGGLFAPTFILSVLGSARVNDIRPRYRLQYFQTLLRMVEFIEDMRTLLQCYCYILTFIFTFLLVEQLTLVHAG